MESGAIVNKRRRISMDDLKKYCGISYGVLSGNISSQSILFAKSGLELILLTVVQEKNQLRYALTWILLFMMIITAILQVNDALFVKERMLLTRDPVILFKQRFTAMRYCDNDTSFKLYF